MIQTRIILLVLLFVIYGETTISFKLKERDQMNCFSETYTSYLDKLQKSEEYYNNLCNVKEKPEVVGLLKFEESVTMIEFTAENNKSNLNDSLLTSLTETSTFQGSSEGIRKNTQLLVDDFRKTKTIQGTLINAIRAEISSYVNSYVNTKKLPVFFGKNLSSLLLVRHQITQITAALALNQTLLNGCLPSSWKYIPYFQHNGDKGSSLTTFYPKQNIENCVPVEDKIEIDPISIETSGQATSFWVFEDHFKLPDSPAQIFIGYVNNTPVHKYELIKINKFYVTHKFTFSSDDKSTPAEFTVTSEASCSQWVFVLISFNTTCDSYNTLISVKFPGTNKSYFKTQKIDFSLIRSLKIMFNSELKFNSFASVSYINTYHNFEYTQTNELNLIYYDYSRLPVNALQECQKKDDCDFVNLQGDCTLCKEGFFTYNNQCWKQCPDGTFLPANSNNVCIQCHSSCWTCKGNLETDCITCKNPFAYYRGRCQLSCPERFAKVLKTPDNYYACDPCKENCRLCTDPTKCDTCFHGFYYYKGDCIGTCLDGMYPNPYSKSCASCDQGCKVCGRVYANYCDICDDGYFLRDGKCFLDCGQLFYPNKTNNQCEICLAHCISCFDNKTCEICNSGYKLNPNKTACINIADCPPGTIAINYICTKCLVEFCQECDMTLYSCKKCNEGYYFKNGSCVKDCGDSFYLDSAGFYPGCKPCADYCTKCSSLTKCLKCDKSYLLIDNYYCARHCPNGYTLSGEVCVRCQNPTVCKSCLASALDICTDCYSLNYLLEGKCVDSCPPKYYYFGSQCKPCVDGCEECYNSLSCNRCLSGYFLQGNLCKLSCDYGFVGRNRMCIQCRDNNCKVCSLDNIYTCNECNEKYYVYNGECYGKCPARTYALGNRCLMCPNNCLSCSSPENCTLCDPASFTYLYNNQCMRICPDGYYGIDGVCRQCSVDNCRLCRNFGLSCIECKDNYFFYENTCKDQCPKGYYINIFTKSCYKCQFPCENCNSLNKCITCPEGYVFKDGICSDECDAGFVKYQGKCTGCPPHCNRCYASNPNICGECAATYFLKDGACFPNCPTKNFGFQQSCFNCGTGCNSCINAYNCNYCVDKLYIFDGNCVSSCPSGYAAVNYQCVPCYNPRCSECDPMNLDLCSRCVFPFVLQQGKCVSTCSKGYYTNLTKMICENCSVSYCGVCSSNISSCDECNYPYLLQENTCVIRCSPGYSQYGTKCVKCLTSNCLKCNNWLNVCDECLDSYFMTDNGRCELDCPVGNYKNTMTKTCNYCSSNCLRCTDNTKCIDCNNFTINYNGVCVYKCPSGYTMQIDKNICVSCTDTYCSECALGIRDSCVNCKYPRRLYKQKCVESCPEKTFYNEMRNECFDCGSYCKECYSSIRCKVCEDGRELTAFGTCPDKCPFGSIRVGESCVTCQGDSRCEICNPNDLKKCIKCKVPLKVFDDKCVDDCPYGYYNSNGFCVACVSNCKRCENQNQCLECNDLFFWYSGICRSDCPRGYYKKNKRCEICASSCEECENETTCTKCPDTMYLQDGECVGDCKSNYFPNGRRCYPCGTNCLKCFSSKVCDNCGNNMVVQDGECVTDCLSGFVSVQGVCMPCDSNCMKCNPYNRAICITCKSKYFFYNGACLNECPMSYYADENSVCKLCNNYCKVCKNGSSCNECISPKKLSAVTGLCVDKCENGYYFMDVRCNKCSQPNCFDCPGDICNYCENNFCIYRNKCYNQCPERTYNSGVNNECLDCGPNCLKCNRLGCITCIDTMANQEGVCISKCERGYVKIDGVCKKCVDTYCDECLSGEMSRCSKCTYPKVKYLGKCYEKCELGFYADNYECKNCGNYCDYCDDWNNCIICKNNYYLQDRICKEKCNNGYYPVNGICRQCNFQFCEACDANACIYCAENYYLKNGMCYPSCGNGYYMVPMSGYYKKCINCLDNCFLCETPNACSKCVEGFYLKENKCVRECGDGWVLKDFLICLKCIDSYCDYCDMNNLNLCKRCRFPRKLQNGFCVEDCNSGWGLIAPGECRECSDTNCKICPNVTDCTYCIDGKYYHEGRCVSPCPSGYRAEGNKCVRCTVERCSICNVNISGCDICSEGFLYKNMCVITCPPRTYSNGKVCIDCESPCRNCRSPRICENCIDGFFYNADTTGCVDKCTDGTVAVDLICKNCEVDNCIKCNPLNLKECITCKNSFAKYLMKCIQLPCPGKTYYDIETNTCMPCPQEHCDVCTGRAADSCKTCEKPFYMNKNRICVKDCEDGYVPVVDACTPCYDKKCRKCNTGDLNMCIDCNDNYYLYNYLCRPDCPIGSYKFTRMCKLCSLPNCYDCEYDIMSNSEICKECKDGFYLNSKGECVNDCPSNYIPVYKKCIRCLDSTCFRCSPEDKNVCISCPPNFYLYKQTCVKDCPYGTYKKDNICEYCGNDCNKCESFGVCNDCILPKILRDGKCIDLKCDKGFVRKGDSCIKCYNSNCEQCNPNNIQECYQCFNGIYLFENDCVTQCPEGYYINNINNTCVKCNLNCRFCENLDTCSECFSNYYLLTGQCSPCSDGNYVIVGKYCYSCMIPNCAKCLPGDRMKCGDCKRGFVLYNSRCWSDCPEKFYNNNSVCNPCGDNCSACNISGCTDCIAPFVLVGNECKSDCPDGSSKNSQNKCVQCHDSNCIKCNGDKPEICYKCNSLTLLHGSECIKSCPNGTYLGDDLKCINCSPYCEKCDKIKCDYCKSPYKLKGGVCSLSCGEGFYINNNNECTPCADSNCIECSLTEYCKRCRAPSVFFPLKKECLPSCPEDYYLDKETNSCFACGGNCRFCRSENECDICIDQFYLYNKKCVNICPENYTPVRGGCERCIQETCKKCESQRPGKCIECTSPTFLYIDTCVPDCPAGTFKNEANRTCEKCNSSCLTCKDATTCITCKSEFIFSDGICLSNCPDNKVNVDGRCECCTDPNCKRCLVDRKTCLECINPLLLNLIDKQCTRICPLETYETKERECKPCPTGCELCNDPTNCTKCKLEYYLFEKACSKECPGGYYRDCNSNYCLKCHETCQTCVDSSNENCPSCNKGFFKSDNLCVNGDNCKLGTFPDSDQKKCISCNIANCDICSSASQCKECRRGYVLDDTSTKCNEYKTTANVFIKPRLYSETSSNKVINNVSFKSDLNSMGVNSNSFTISYWIRMITPLANNSNTKDEIIFEINPNSEFGMFTRFILQKSPTTVTCVGAISFKSTDIKVSMPNCNLFQTNSWKFFALTVSKSSRSDGMISLSSYNENSVVITNKELIKATVLDQNAQIITKTSTLLLDKNPNESSLFELANINVMEYIPNNEDLLRMYGQIPNNCDYQCIECSDKCYTCKNGPVLSDGSCSAGFISLFKELYKVTKAVNYVLKDFQLNHHLSSDKYSFGTFFYLTSNTNPTNTLTQIYYKYQKLSQTIFNLQVVKNELQLFIGNDSVTNLPKVNIDFDKWYSLALSISSNGILLRIHDSKGNKIMDFTSKLSTDKIIRITEESIISFGNADGVSYLSNYDTRFYINNIMSSDDLLMYQTNFRIPLKCSKCNEELKCLQCDGLLVVKDNQCVESDYYPSNQEIPAYNTNNKDPLIITLLENTMSSDCTFTTWSKVSTFAQQTTTTTSSSASSQNVLSLVDSSSYKLYSIIQYSIEDNQNYTYTIDLSQLSQDSTKIAKISIPFNQVTNANNGFAITHKKANTNGKQEISVTYNGSSKSQSVTAEYTNQLADKLVCGGISGSMFSPQVGPTKIYQNKVFTSENLNKIMSIQPVECDPSCLKCNYETGYCLSCFNNQSSKFCDPFVIGFKSSFLLSDNNYGTSIKQSSSTNINDYVVNLSSSFKHGVNSSTYSVIGWFKLFDYKTDANKSNGIVFRISNNDSLSSTSFNPNLNVLSMVLVNKDDSNFNYAFVISDGQKDNVFNIDSLPVKKNEWLLINAGINGSVFKYSIVTSSDTKSYDKEITLTFTPGKLLPNSTFSIFGANNFNTQDKIMSIAGFFYNFNTVINRGFDTDYTKKYLDAYPKPNDENPVNTCNKSCLKCIEGICLQCNEGYFLSNNNCANLNTAVDYLLLTDQQNINAVTRKITFPPNIITENHGFQFTFRRNFQPFIKLSNNNNLTQRTIISLGNIKISLIASPSYSYIRIDNYIDPSVSMSLGPLDSDSSKNYQFYTVLLNIKTKENTFDAILFDKTYKQLVKRSARYTPNTYDSVLVDTLDRELTITDIAFIIGNSNLVTPLFTTPEIDCNIDCTLCQGRYKCMECNYGFVANDDVSNKNRCNSKPIKPYGFSLTSGYPKNSFKLSEFFPDEKIIRFKNFAILFSVNLSNKYYYNNILRIINNDDTKMEKYDPKSINYNMLSLSLDKYQNKFSLSYHNRNSFIRNGNPVSTLVNQLQPSQNLNDMFFIGLSFNKENSKFTIAMYNSVDNVMTDSVPIEGEFENLGLNTNFIFGDDFVKLNYSDAVMNVNNIEFYYERSLSSLELLNKLTNRASVYFSRECVEINKDDKSCTKCSDISTLKEGLCFPKDIGTNLPKVAYKDDIINNVKEGDINDIVLSDLTSGNLDAFTLAFYYRRLITPKGNLSNIISLCNKKDNDCTAEYINMQQKDDQLLLSFNISTNNKVSFSLSNVFDKESRFAWVYISVTFDSKQGEISLSSFNLWNQTVLNINKKYPANTLQALAITNQLAATFSRKNTNSGDQTGFSIYSVTFTPNYAFKSQEVLKFKPPMIFGCSDACGCFCPKGVCPDNCRLDRNYIDLSTSIDSKSSTSIFSNINTYINNQVDANGNGFGASTKNSNMAYSKFSLSFIFNNNNFIQQSTSNSTSNPNNNNSSSSTGTYNSNGSTSRKENPANISNNKSNVLPAYNSFLGSSNGLYSQAFNFKKGHLNIDASIREQLTTKIAQKDSTATHLHTAISSNPNSNVLFVLTNEFDSVSTLSATDKIDQSIINNSIFALTINENNLRLYIGSSAQDQQIKYRDILIKNKDLRSIKNIIFLFYVDTEENFTKLVLYADDIRIDFGINISYQLERINKQTVFYKSAYLSKILLNVGSNGVDRHLKEIQTDIDNNLNFNNFCDYSCKSCYLLNSGRLNACLKCGLRKRMMNSSCIDITNSKRINIKKKMKQSKQKFKQ